jgi:SAM-dependent methyltransferase
MASSPSAHVGGPPLKSVDRWLRSWRIRKAAPFVAQGARVLDVGCHDGELFRALAPRIVSGVGVDPMLTSSSEDGRFRFLRGSFPDVDLPPEAFDVVMMLAVLEHVDEADLYRVREACERALVPGGRVVITVPSPRVDDILHVLGRLRLIAGVAVHEHHGFDPRVLPRALGGGELALSVRRSFQLGLNNLLVFTRR